MASKNEWGTIQLFLPAWATQRFVPILNRPTTTLMENMNSVTYMPSMPLTATTPVTLPLPIHA